MLGLNAQNNSQPDLDLEYGKDLLAPGTPAPDFTLNDVEGNPVSLSDFKGRKVVLQFWASWCPDCRAEVPEIKAAQSISMRSQRQSLCFLQLRKSLFP